MAYVVILCLVVILGTTGLAFIHRVGIELDATDQRGACMQAHYLAEAAAHHGMWRLINEPGFPAAEDVYYMHAMDGGRYGYKVRKNTNTTFATIATVGAIEGHTIHQSYVLHIPPILATGDYTGNNVDGRTIAGLGFEPDVVIIKGDTDAEAVIRTSTMSGDVTKKMTGAQNISANSIQALTSNGFVIGNNKEVNQPGVDFYWVAFKSRPSLMKVGSYSGDGTSNRIIDNIGFDPKLIMIIPENGYEMVHRSHLAMDSYDFGNSDGITNCLTTPLPADGFQLGSNNRVNRSGEKYHYVCWAEVAGYTRFETYMGNDWDNRNITGVGFKPEYVIVRAVSDGKSQVHYPASLGSGVDSTLLFRNNVNRTNRIQALISDGFQVGDARQVNESGVIYAYFAWALR